MIQMGNNSDYIKDIENYFLSLAGKGIMLSSMDYNLITDWRKRKIPKEVILKGINRAFEDTKLRYGQGASSIRNLKQCLQYINNSIEEFKPIIGKEANGLEIENTSNELSRIVDQINKFIDAEKSEVVRNYYIELKESLLAALNENSVDIIGNFSHIEEKSLENFFDKLPSSEQEQISLEAQSLLGDRARHMTEEAIDESITSFRNEIISNKYNIKNIL